MSTDTPSDPHPPTLDATALARLRELDPDGRQGVLPRVLTAFESSLTRMLGQLGALQGGGDPAAVATIAHTLKSGAAAVGALELAEHCSRIERALRGGDHAHLSADIERLLASGERALAAVRSILHP